MQTMRMHDVRPIREYSRCKRSHASALHTCWLVMVLVGFTAGHDREGGRSSGDYNGSQRLGSAATRRLLANSTVCPRTFTHAHTQTTTKK